jgi:hypothetical protein
MYFACSEREIAASWAPLTIVRPSRYGECRSRPANWLQLVARPQTEAELAALCRSAIRGCPYGDADGAITTAKSLGLESAMRSRGRLKQNWSSFESTGLSATCANYQELVAGHLFVGPMDLGQPGRLAAVPSVV